MALFYAIAGVLALATALLLVRPLLSRRREAAGPETKDAQLYRDQLDEVERDLARGTIGADEAAGARAEVSRRLIAATERAEATAGIGPAPERHSRLLAGIALVAAPALAAAIYLSLGAPGLPDLPFAERGSNASQQARLSQAKAEEGFTPQAPATLTEEQQDYAILITRLEAMLEQRPDDIQGLELLATGYMRLGRYSESWRTFEKLAAVASDEVGASHYASMAEAMVLAAGGYVSPEAEAAIGEALSRDPDLPIARYYSGLLMAQSGRIDAAITIWEKLRTETPSDAPWVGFLDGMLTEARAMRDGTVGPSAAEVEAAAAMSPEERQAMIEGMVAGLEERLTTDGGSVEEWLRLMNAYAQLGRKEDAARIARLGIDEFGSSTEADFLHEQALVMGLFEE